MSQQLFHGKRSSERYPVYTGKDLGAVYAPDQTSFCAWAPSADQVILRIYKEGQGDNQLIEIHMYPADNGTWRACVRGDWHGYYYTYQVCIHGRWLKEVTDPYAKGCGVNGRRGMILNMKATDPEGFAEDHGPAVESPVDMIIAETSVADATVNRSSRVVYAGKYLGLTERGTLCRQGYATGLDHLVEMGVTHVQMMPFYDFNSVDESKVWAHSYNWGYDPQNYNVPEGSYATDPFHGEIRIRECKQMIQSIHKAGLGVIMDVVYNHMGDARESSFENLVPGYYFRMANGSYSNGSGCGNELASEKPMVREFLVDSLCYWVKQYHVDGFRFDLMGLLDIETLNLAAKKLRKLKPDIVLYGEGWTGGTSPLEEKLRAVKGNVRKLNGYGMFSDDIRDNVKGNVFDQKGLGFANGAKNYENELRFAVAAGLDHPQVSLEDYRGYGTECWAKEPAQVINYLSCHDNLTLWDKLQLSCPEATEEERLRMNRLCAAILMTSQGVPFFLEGEEFARSKPVEGTGQLSANSYNLPEYTNSLKYDRIGKYYSLQEYYKGLIAFRKAHPALRLRSGESIARNLVFMEGLKPNVVGFTVRDEKNTEEILVIYNANETSVSIAAGDKTAVWDICVKDTFSGTEILSSFTGRILVDGRSALIAVRRK